MQSELSKFFEELVKDIQNAYEASVTIEEAEKLAAKFLYAQIKAGDELKRLDLDARMRKSGLKALKAKAYMDAATAGEKKPTEAMLEALINRNELVIQEQDGLDSAETERNAMDNYLNIFREAHIFFRSVSKGRFE